jgi:hypothetical protein
MSLFEDLFGFSLFGPPTRETPYYKSDSTSSKPATDLQIPEEMHDFIKVLEMGAKKYAPNNWLEPEGKSSSEIEMHDHMGHHWARSYASIFNGDRLDESGLDHLLHLACRALMLYTRRQRNIRSSKDA